MSDGKDLEKRTLVEDGTEFTGKLSSRCPIVVMGKVEGQVSGPSIHVTSTGSIAGTVKVAELRSEGEIAGEIEAESVQLSGRVRDATVIRTRSLEVSLRRADAMEVVFGDCELAVGDEPSKEAAIAAAIAGPQVAAPAIAPPAPSREPVAPVVAATPAAAPVEPTAPAEAAWDETAGAAADDGDDKDDGRRKRDRLKGRTQPPPPA